MKRSHIGLLLAAVIVWFCTSTPAPATGNQEQPAQVVRHDFKVALQPDQKTLQVEDTVTLPEKFSREVHFILHGKLKPVTTTAGVELSEVKGPVAKGADFGMTGDINLENGRVPLEHFVVTLPEGQKSFTLSYGGEIHHPAGEGGEQYARAFNDTPGIISSEGIHLAGPSSWYPWFNGDLVTFTLDVQAPEPWIAVSQGTRTKNATENGVTSARWEELTGQDDIYIIGAKFVEYDRQAGDRTAMAFLRQKDDALAARYLDATVRYLAMYDKLIGPYPYTKFAMVENFWETGYGMPSFTLLGSSVIRLPFIVNTSYPHEILHNWWGNSVYVDWASGNWCEGLTVYLADHMLAEQDGKGVDYRRASLQGYADYVAAAPGKDFPLTQFRSRHSRETQAVGYGKTMMLFHMLRVQLGDDGFIAAVRKLYQDGKYKVISFADVERVFEASSGKDLKREFKQWVTLTGAPAIKVSGASAKPDGDGFLLTATIEQTQAGDTYLLRIPVAVTLEGRPQPSQSVVTMSDKKMELSLRLPARPVRLDVDTEFDVFRQINRDEVPPAITQALGAQKSLILLPSKAGKGVLAGYSQLADALKKQWTGELEIKTDADIEELPSDRAVWIMGWGNKFGVEVETSLEDYGVSFKDDGVVLDGKEVGHDRALVLCGRNPANPAMALTWVAGDKADIVAGLGRKLVHYGKYSYLVFGADGGRALLQGQWTVASSPMSVPVAQADGSVPKAASAKPAPRKALVGKE